MRFTVHRPPNGEVSLCWYRPSGGDVAGGVDVGVARPALQATQEKTAWLLRFSGAMCPQAEHRCEVYAAGARSIRPGFVVESGNQPPCLTADARLRPLFCATRTPGWSIVPRAVRVIARTSSASTRIVSNRRARSVVVFSTQSRRRSASRALSFAIASLARCRRLEPGLARARLRCRRRSRIRSPGVRQGRAAARQWTAPPTPPPRGRHRRCCGRRSGDRVGDVREGDMPAPSPISTDAIGLHACGYGSGAAEAEVAHLGHPYLPVAAVDFLNMARVEPDLPEAFVHASLAPRRAAMGPAKKFRIA